MVSALPIWGATDGAAAVAEAAAAAAAAAAEHITCWGIYGGKELGFRYIHSEGKDNEHTLRVHTHVCGCCSSNSSSGCSSMEGVR